MKGDKLNNQKLLVKAEDFNPEDVSGYQGTFFTNASQDEVRLSSRKLFLYSFIDLPEKLYVLEYPELGEGTSLRILVNKPKFKDLAELISSGFITRVECFGAGKSLNHIDELVKILLSQGKKILIFPFVKNKPELLGPQNPMGC